MLLGQALLGWHLPGHAAAEPALAKRRSARSWRGAEVVLTRHVAQPPAASQCSQLNLTLAKTCHLPRTAVVFFTNVFFFTIADLHFVPRQFLAGKKKKKSILHEMRYSAEVQGLWSKSIGYTLHQHHVGRGSQECRIPLQPQHTKIVFEATNCENWERDQ